MQKILIVDDDRATRTALRTRFSSSNYETLEAASGQAAIDQFNSNKPNIILLDASMPDMSGFEVCRQMRASDPERRTKIFFLSGADTPSVEYVERCVGVSDADGYFRKPYDIGELMATVGGADA